MQSVPRMLRSTPLLRRGALLIRGPYVISGGVGPGSAEQRKRALHRVPDT
jgi:hypothetical protein